MGNQEVGLQAVQEAARRYDGFEVDTETAFWYDMEHASTGAKAEVKSALVERSNGREGEFILRWEQHRSLLSADASGVAWYVFIARQGSNPKKWKSVRKKPSTVSDVVDEWKPSAHRRYSKEARVPVSDVF